MSTGGVSQPGAPWQAGIPCWPQAVLRQAPLMQCSPGLQMVGVGVAGRRPLSPGVVVSRRGTAQQGAASRPQLVASATGCNHRSRWVAATLRVVWSAGGACAAAVGGICRTGGA